MNRSYIIYILLLTLFLLALQSVGKPLFVWTEVNYLLQPYDLRGLAKGGLYAVGYALSILAVASVVGMASRRWSIGLILICGLFYGLDFFVQLVGGPRGLSVEELQIAYSQKHLIGYLKAYTIEMLYAALGGLGVIALLWTMRRLVKEKKIKKGGVFLVWIAAIVLCFASVNKVYSILYNAYPAPIKGPAIVIDFLVNQQDKYHRLVDSSILPNISTQSDKNLIWIIDESVTGSYLSCNGYDQPTTPWLDKAIANDTNLINLGVVNSISNCSNTSNHFLRVGLTPNMSFDTLPYLPSILSYANNAGYKIVMLDGQITKGELTNYITPEEMDLVNELYTCDRSIKPSNRDELLNQKLYERLAKVEDEKLFVIYIKWGCHWPYLLNFEGKQPVFTPIQPSTATRMTLENRELMRNTYHNSIYYNVDAYLKEVFTMIDPSNNAVFYTSDHGQAILERNTARTHCSSNVETIPRSEFDVPMIVYGLDSLKVNKNTKYSQIQLFVTTLQLMGYPQSVTDLYGTSLFEGGLSNRQSFITGTGKLFQFY